MIFICYFFVLLDEDFYSYRSTDAAFSVDGPDETGEESLSPAFRWRWKQRQQGNEQLTNTAYKAKKISPVLKLLIHRGKRMIEHNRE